MFRSNIVKSLLVIALALGIGLQQAQAASYHVNVAGGDGRVGDAVFDVVGGNLKITLSNLGDDVLNPTEILTGVFFDTSPGSLVLTPVSAVLGGGSTVFFDADGQPAGGVVGGEWEYLAGLSGAPGGAKQGISSAGFGLFGDPNFPGANLDGPDAVDGLQYGITSSGDDTTLGNAAVTGGNPLIQHRVIFTLSGLPDEFDPETMVTNVSFQYGTSLAEPNDPGGPNPKFVPEGSSLALLCGGLLPLLGAAKLFRRRKTAA